MVAVKGIYEGGNTVKIDESELNIAEPYEVVVSFLQPAKKLEKETADMLKTRTTHWLDRSWKIPNFKPLTREELYDRSRIL